MRIGKPFRVNVEGLDESTAVDAVVHRAKAEVLLEQPQKIVSVSCDAMQAKLDRQSKTRRMNLRLELPPKSNWRADADCYGTKYGILMPDGVVISPEVEVINQYRNVFNRVSPGVLIGRTGSPDELT